MATKKPKSIKKDIPTNGTNVNGTKLLTGVLFSKEPNTKVIRANEVRHHGSAAERIAMASDTRLRNRIYLKLKDGDSMPTSGVGEGEYAYVAKINGIYDRNHATEEQNAAIQEAMASNSKEDDNINKLESALLSLGYTGFLAGNIITVLDMNIKVQKFETEQEKEELIQPEADIKEEKKELPKAQTKRKLTKKDANSLSTVLPVLKTKAPSANIISNTLVVNDDEYQSFLKEAQTFPNMPKFIKDDLGVQEDNLEDTNTQTNRLKRFSKQRKRKAANKDLTDTIQRVLMDERFLKTFTGKVSETLQKFGTVSKEYQEGKKETPEEHAAKTNIDPVEEKTESNELLTEIRDILNKLADATTKDDVAEKEDARNQLQTILEHTKTNSVEEHEFVTNTLNTVLKEMKREETEDDLNIKSKEPLITPVPTTEKTITETSESGNELPIIDGKEQTRPDLAPIEPKQEESTSKKSDQEDDLSDYNKRLEDFKKKKPMVEEDEETTSPETKEESKPKPVELVEQEKEVPEWQKRLDDLKRVGTKDITPPELMPPEKETSESAKPSTQAEKPATEQPYVSQEKRGQPVKVRGTFRKERVTEDKDTGTKTTTPSFTPIPKNLSTTDTLLGAFINRKKDIVTTDKDGNEISRRAGANKVEYTKRLVRKGDEFLGEGGTMSLIRLMKNKKKKTQDAKIESKEKVTGDLSDDKQEPKIKSNKKTLLGSLVSSVKGIISKPLASGSIARPNRTAKEIAPDTQTAKPTTEKEITPQEPESASALETAIDLASNLPSKGGLLKRGAGLLGKAGKAIGKYAAPLAAGASVIGGISDIAEGGKIESATDVIPKGGLLDKLNPFNYVMNAGRYVGDKWNQGYGAVSSAVGGTGSLGTDLYDMVNGKSLDPNDPNAPHAPPRLPKPKENVPVDLKPKLEQHDLKPSTMEITNAAQEKEIKGTADTATTSSSSTNISNVTNNTSPVQQIMPSNMMAQRNGESAYRTMVNRKFSI